jgi:hypothetical protein
VKYAFLPIAAAIVIYLAVYAMKGRLRIKQLSSGFSGLNKWVLIAGLGGIILLGGLAFERYGLNAVRYGTPLPGCGKVLDYNHCRHYGPWNRDYFLERNKGDFQPNSLEFAGAWFKGMWQRSFFAISGPWTDYHNKLPLWLPGYGTVLFALAGLISVVVAAKRLWRRYDGPALWLFVTVSLAYVGLLYWDQYDTYRGVGKAVAINGRYLLLVLPLVVLVVSMAVNELLGRHGRIRATVAGVVVLSLLWGGGALTYVLQSDDDWYWPHTPLRPANHIIQNTLGPITPGYKH